MQQGKWPEALSLGNSTVPLMAYHADMGKERSHLDSDSWPPMHTRSADSSVVRNAVHERPIDSDYPAVFGELQGSVHKCAVKILPDVIAQVGGTGCTLLLVETANSTSKLRSALSFLTHSFGTNVQNLAGMSNTCGFQILGELLKQRSFPSLNTNPN